MLRVFLALIVLIPLACSPDRPAPIAPAGKATQMGLGGLLGTFEPAEDENNNEVEEAEEDTTAIDEPFNIQLVYLDVIPFWAKDRIREAADSWEEVIVEGFPDVEDYPIKIRGRVKRYDVDDFIVFVTNAVDDYTYQSWATVWGPRDDGSSASGFPIGGIINMDLPVIDQHINWPNHRRNIRVPQEALLSEENTLRKAATHEIGHLLGLAGGRELDVNLVKNDAFTGKNVVRVFGQPLPLHQDPPCNCHWDGDYYLDGVMSYPPSSMAAFQRQIDKEFVLFRSRRIRSFVTEIEVAALDDIGYRVDYFPAQIGSLQGKIPAQKAGKRNTEVQAETTAHPFCAGVVYQ